MYKMPHLHPQGKSMQHLQAYIYKIHAAVNTCTFKGCVNKFLVN
jgi:hypothetical protein